MKQPTSTLILIIKRDLLLSFRNFSALFNPILFFIVIATLFPLAISSKPNILANIASGVIWVSALLATLLSLDRLFKEDFLDGSLEQLLQSPRSLYLIILGKIIAHWLTVGLPLLLVSPLLAVVLFLPNDAIFVLMMVLLIGTPSLSLIGAIGMGLTVGLNQGGVLLSLLILPLYIPVLIVGTMAIGAHISGLPIGAYFYILGAIFMMALTFAPITTVAAIKISIGQQ